MVTGFVERKEDPLETLRRELSEELGLRLAASQFIGHYLFAEANQLILAFLADGVGSLTLGEELAEVKLLNYEEAWLFDFGRLELTSRIFRDARSLIAKAP